MVTVMPSDRLHTIAQIFTPGESDTLSALPAAPCYHVRCLSFMSWQADIHLHIQPPAVFLPSIKDHDGVFHLCLLFFFAFFFHRWWQEAGRYKVDWHERWPDASVYQGCSLVHVRMTHLKKKTFTDATGRTFTTTISLLQLWFWIGRFLSCLWISRNYH